MSRRGFLAGCGALMVGWTGPIRLHARCGAPSAGRGGPHPEPRRGIDASKVLAPERLRDEPDAVPAFDAARRIPQLLDGIRCQCGCAEAEGHYSLLSCFEGEEAMALTCVICQGQARLADRMARAGSTLAEIRSAIDARYG